MLMGSPILFILLINGSFIDAFGLVHSNLSFQKVTKASSPQTRLGGTVGDETKELSDFAKQLLSRGKPSSPGWKNRKLDELTEWATSDDANRPIVCEYEPDGMCYVFLTLVYSLGIIDACSHGAII